MWVAVVVVERDEGEEWAAQGPDFALQLTSEHHLY